MDEEIQFVNPPPYDYTCPVCLQLPKDAHQTTCCGNHICYGCITRLKSMPDVTCPQCRHDNFDATPDKFFSRQLQNLEVRCHYSNAGCGWTGELRCLEKHLETSCKRHVVACQHCNSKVSSSSMKDHLPICEELFIDCPNGCPHGKNKRKKIQNHLENECPLRVIISSSRSVDSIPFAANMIVQIAPLSFTMTNYSQCIKSEDPWFSPPFYSHNEGYKLCFKVFADYYNNAKVSVLACVLKGEYDRLLQWPLHAEVEVSLFNWRDNANHFNKTLYLTGDHLCSQTFTENLPLLGKGNSEFIPHNELVYNSDKNTEYLQHNCLSFRVNKVSILPTPKTPELPPWATEKCVCHFVVTSFAFSKNKAAIFHSPPFYTHDRGYKLCALAYLDGFDTGKGSHVSLYATLMKGEHDDVVAWPFSGDVCISMLNWRKDKNHQECTIRFNKGIASAATARVVAGHNLAPKFWGYPQFIAHSALPYNQSEKTEFLRDNCLLFKVKSVVVYSSFGISKAPSWRHSTHNSQPLCEFTLSQFSVRKQHNNEYYSDAFFSHRNGYKMQLRVDANKKGHVGVFVFLMKGPNDDSLLWPFSGDVTVELLNWRDDSCHYKKIIELSANVTNTARHRVTDGERGSGWGHEQYIQHSALEVNDTNNTQYLQDDCLYFRVKEVAVYSSALCQKYPWWQNPQSVSPYLEFTLTNFSKHCDLGTSYISNAFLAGYNLKMRLEVKARRTNVDLCKHVAVYAGIMKGENDDNLVWPLEADIVIELLNWRGNVNHQVHTISFNERTPTAIRSQVTSGEANSESWGTHELIPYTSLSYNNATNTEYLQDDCLRFRVKEVVVYSTPHSRKIPNWQSRFPRFPEFTVTQISRRMKLENVFYSHPFYTSQGYKMCLKVHASGYGSAKGTHVSVYAYLLKGDHDDTIRWPFTGDIVIEILNWKGDHSHHRKVLQFNDDSTDDSRNRVYEADIAPKGWGNGKVVPHSILFPRYASDTEYLEDDCMCIRLYDVAVYNTPLLSKTPQWQNRLNTSSSWLLEFTVTGVSKHKLYDTEHISPPFYTHKNGYKMRLEVWPNGNSDGKGTHLSIFARLLKGENDHNLKWPMNIDLTVEVINWRSNNSHITHVTNFQHAPATVCAQVTGENKIATARWGTIKFCTHYTLFDNSRNTQYVQDDCIRVRVKGAIVFSRKGFFSFLK